MRFDEAAFTKWMGSFILSLFGVLTVSPAFSWDDKGHRIVVMVAEMNLTPDARRHVQEIVPAGTTLADAAVWPDHEGRGVTDLNPLHYVNIPDNADSYEQTRDCPERNCMVEALKWFLLSSADKNAPVVMRRIALRFVAHLVGDMHQPLHAARAEDRGGVDIAVSHRGHTTNLHYFWDTDLVEMEEGDPGAIAERLGASVAEEERLKWQAGEPKEWTEESLILARSYAYNIGRSGELSDEYVEKTRPVVRRRLVQAGIRLAWLLNNIFK
jgi:hypothetical protein